jgi:hypothetical protein
MGYDYRNDTTELYTSYNHGWYFYKYLDEEHGLRFIYQKRGRDVLPFLLKMRDSMRGSPAWLTNYCEGDKQVIRKDLEYLAENRTDGWTPTLGNALWFLERIIAECIRSPNSKWSGD